MTIHSPNSTFQSYEKIVQKLFSDRFLSCSWFRFHYKWHWINSIFMKLKIPPSNFLYWFIYRNKNFNCCFEKVLKGLHYSSSYMHIFNYFWIIVVKLYLWKVLILEVTENEVDQPWITFKLQNVNIQLQYFLFWIIMNDVNEVVVKVKAGCK